MNRPNIEAHRSLSNDFETELCRYILELEIKLALALSFVPETEEMSGFDEVNIRDDADAQTIAEACVLHGVEMPPHIKEVYERKS